MRTTLTLDDDVAVLVEEEVHRSRKPFKQVVNDSIRRGLAPRGAPQRSKPYETRPHISALAPGIDPMRFNSLVDELEDDAIVETLLRSKP